MASIKTIIFLSLVVVLVYGCANQLPPGGGDIDRIPPVIVEAFPANETTMFNENYIEFTFSEYVDRRSVQESIFFSPAIDSPLEFDWSGRTVRIIINDSLKKNITYVVTLGTAVQDVNNGNKLLNAFNLTFSTGEKIDRGSIEGAVFGDKIDGVMIYAYRLSDEEIDPTKIKPDYISQIGASGLYKLEGLSKGKYRVFAIMDNGRNSFYDIGADEFGVPNSDIILSEKDSTYIGLNFLLSREDTASPRLQSAIMTDRNHILIETSEPIKKVNIRPKFFKVINIKDKQEIVPVFAFKGNTKENQFFIVVDDSINMADEYLLYADELIDEFDNISFPDTVRLTTSEREDTTSPKIISVKGNVDRNIISIESAILELNFDDAVNKSAMEGIKIIDEKNKYLLSDFDFIDDAHIKIFILDKLRSKSEYKLIINYNFITDIVGNSLDSTQEFKFYTLNDLELAGVSGEVVNSEKDVKTILILKSYELKNLEYKTETEKSNEFNFDGIKPGKYRLMAFMDADSSSTYSFGKPFPFKPSEKFIFYPDTLNLRPRWPIGDLKINFNN